MVIRLKSILGDPGQVKSGADVRVIKRIARPRERFLGQKLANGSTSSIKSIENSEMHNNSTCTWRILSKVQFLLLLKSGWWETITLEIFDIVLIGMMVIMITIMIIIMVKIVKIIISSCLYATTETKRDCIAIEVWTVTKQACRDESIVSQFFSTSATYFALYSYVSSTVKRKIYIYIYIYKYIWRLN